MLWHLIAGRKAQSAAWLCKFNEYTVPSGAEGASLLAHKASDHDHLVLSEGMLCYDAIHAVVVGELITPDIKHPRNMSASKVRIAHVQHAGAGPFRSASSAGMTVSSESQHAQMDKGHARENKFRLRYGVRNYLLIMHASRLVSKALEDQAPRTDANPLSSAASSLPSMKPIGILEVDDAFAMAALLRRKVGWCGL